jgi:hypothetical protein
LFPVSGALHIAASTYVLCVVSGVGSALLAVLATVLVYASEDGFRRLPIHWMWWPAIGGLIIGVGGLIVPQSLGVGYDVIDAELTGSISLGLVAGILVTKTLIWSLSLGSGTSGGVLAPMFMIGGALGTLEAHIFPTVGTGFWPLVALAGVLGGVMRSPFTGVIFAVELTGRFNAILPLMIGASVAFGVSVLVLKRSVLTEKIARRGYHLSREYDVDPLEMAFVEDVMRGDVTDIEDAPRVYVDDTLRHTAYVMAEAHQTRCAVVTRDENPELIGSIELVDLLAGRRRDLHEMAHAERVIRVRLPARRLASRGRRR